MQEKVMRKTTVYLPPATVEALKQRAKTNRRSFNSEVVFTLEKDLQEKISAQTLTPEKI